MNRQPGEGGSGRRSRDADRRAGVQVAAVLQPAEIEAMHRRLKQLPEPPERARWSVDDGRGAPGG